MSGSRLSLIAAVAKNGVIGAGGKMPWRLSSDMKRFRRLTLGKPVIMGRKTFEAIGKALDGRVNIVVTRRAGFAAPDVIVAPSVEAAIGVARDLGAADRSGEVMVIGGGEIYAVALPLADRLYITRVEAAPEGDTSFPDIDPRTWKPIAAEQLPAGDKDSAATEFVIYERMTASENFG